VGGAGAAAACKDGGSAQRFGGPGWSAAGGAASPYEERQSRTA